MEANEQSFRTSRTILGAHPIGDDDFFGDTNPSDVTMDIANSKEIMTESQITEQHTLKYQGSIQPELLDMTPYKPQAYDSPQNYQLDSPNNLKDLKILSKSDNVTNNIMNTPATDVLHQENQDYYNRQDQ